MMPPGWRGSLADGLLSPAFLPAAPIAARSRPAIPREAEVREAEEQHGPGRGFGDEGTRSHDLPGVVDGIGHASAPRGAIGTNDAGEGHTLPRRRAS